MPKEKKLIGTGVKQKALSAEEKKRLEEKEKKEKEKERKERKAREAMDRTFGMKGRKAREKVERDMKNNPHANTPATAEARRAQAEARMREKKKMKEAEEQAKRELDVLMGVVSDVSITKRPTKEETEEERASRTRETAAAEEEKRRKIEEKKNVLKDLERKQAEMQRQELMGPGVKLKPGEEGYDPYEDYPDATLLGGDFREDEERENVFKRLMKAACGLTKKGEVRNAVGGILSDVPRTSGDDEVNV